MLSRVGKGGPNQWFLYAKFCWQELSQRTQFLLFLEAADVGGLSCYIGERKTDAALKI